MEPPIKKLKLDDAVQIILDLIDQCIENIQNSTQHFKVVINDNVYNSLPCIKVYIGHLKSVKDISRAILILNEKVPLKELQHLKRARGPDIVLCPTDYLADDATIQDFIKAKIGELIDIFSNFEEVDVPSLPPKVKRQFIETKRMWPCNFHPNVNLEKLVNNEFFSNTQLQTHRKYMRLAFEIAKWNIKNKNNNKYSIDNVNATVVVDPSIDSVVVVSFDNRLEHPVQHSAMLAIDNVAKTQNGGAWLSNDFHTDKKMLLYFKEKFPDIKFGYKQFISKKESKSSNEEGPYLCTGYHIYILREPCFMCSMALVHARAKQIFFCTNNLHHGALKSLTKLQEVASLNHHFDVFTGFF